MPCANIPPGPRCSPGSWAHAPANGAPEKREDILKKLPIRPLIPVAALFMAPAVMAADATCPETPKADWLRPEEVQVRLQSQGLEVKRVKREGSCYEVRAKNREGQRIEAYVNPTTAAIVKQKVKS